MSQIRKVYPVRVARDVVTDTAKFTALPPAALQIAWVTLMEVLGKTVRLKNIGEPAHIIGNAGIIPAAAMQARIKSRVLAHAASIGRTGPTPLILPEARPVTPPQTPRGSA